MRCSGGVAESPPPPPVDWRAFDVHGAPAAPSHAPTARERAVAEAYAAALASPELSRLGPLLDDDAHSSFPGLADARGRGQVVRLHELLFGPFDERKVATTRVWRTDSTQALEWTLAGVQARDWMGVAATHAPVVFRGVTLLWTRDDGMVTDVHVYFDVAAVQAQLGAGPKELRALPPPPWPTGPAQAVEQTGSPDELRNVATVRAELDALDANDEGAYLARMADGVEVSTPEGAEPARGKDDARAYFKAMHKAIAQLDTTIDSVWGFPGYAVVEYSIAGEQVGRVGWVPPGRDRVVRLDVVDVVEVRDGLVTRIWRYDNLEQLASPGP